MKRRSFGDWFRACEGWSLPASAMASIAVIGWLRWRQGDGGFAWGESFAALVMMMVFQAGSSALSDTFDHLSGVDRPDDPKVTWFYDGTFTISTIRKFAAVLIGVGILLGGWILWNSRYLDLAAVGMVGVIIGVGYSFLKYRALGDLAIWLDYAVLPALGLSRLLTGEYQLTVLLAVLPIILLLHPILHANNWRDRAADRAAGIVTVPILLGDRGSRMVYGVEVVGAYLAVIVGVAIKVLPPMTLAVSLTLPKAIANLRCRDLTHLDRETAKLLLGFGLVFFAALMSSRV